MTAPEQRLGEWIRERLHGQCQIVSKGNGCLCPLCDLDRIVTDNDRLRERLRLFIARLEKRIEWLESVPADEGDAAQELRVMKRELATLAVQGDNK